jgi:hypothetical protein
VGQFEIVILSKPLLRSEEPALSEVEGIWASRAKRRFFGRRNRRPFGSLPYQFQTDPLPNKERA